MGPFLLAMALVASNHDGARGVAAIDSACAATGGHARPRIFVEVSGAVLPRGRQGRWRELATEGELHALSEGTSHPNTEGIVRSTRGGTLVSMYFQDASASWAHVAEYCFRKEGLLARLQGTFNSFTAVGSGPGIRRRRAIYYDARGTILRWQRSPELVRDRQRLYCFQQ